MPVPAAELRAMLTRHRLEGARIGAVTAGLVVEVGASHLAGKMTTAEFGVALVAAEKLGFQRAATTSARHVAEVRAVQGARPGPVVQARFPLGAAEARAKSTLDALVRLDDPAARRRAVETHAVWADRAAKMGGRRTVERSAGAAGRRWRRVPDADPCTFCAMLATRGFLDAGYRSKKTALTTDKGDKYHDRCGCTATEIVGAWEPSAQERRWIDLYEDAAAAADATRTPRLQNVILRFMKAYGDFHDSPSRTQDDT